MTMLLTILAGAIGWAAGMQALKMLGIISTSSKTPQFIEVK